MKDICIIDKLEDLEETITVGLEMEYYLWENSKWERIKYINKFKLTENKNNKFIKLEFDANTIDNIPFGEYKIRVCIYDDRCQTKVINKKRKNVYLEIKEITFDVLNIIKKVDGGEKVLEEIVFGKVLDIKNIDNDNL